MSQLPNKDVKEAAKRSEIDNMLEDMGFENIKKKKLNLDANDIAEIFFDHFYKHGSYTALLTKYGVGPGTAVYDNVIEMAFQQMRTSYKYLMFVANQMDRKIRFDIATAQVEFNGHTFNLAFNPEFYVCLGFMWDEKKKSIVWSEEQAKRQGAFAMAHECTHFIAQHIPRMMKAEKEDRAYYSLAMELAVNSMFLNGHDLPKWTVNISSYFALDQKTQKMSMFPPKLSVEAYIKLLKIGKKSKDGGTTFEDVFEGNRFMDLHEWFNDNLTPEQKDTFEAMQRVIAGNMVSKATNSAASAGCLPGDFQGMIDAMLSADDVPFGEVFQGYLARSKSHTRKKSVMRPSRRIPTAGGKRKSTSLSVTFMQDVSGSMSDEDIELLHGEAITASVRHRANVMIQQFDHGLQGQPMSAHDFIRNPVVKGRGGTELSHVFDFLNKTQPDIGVICTDGFVFVPKELPDCPIIWVITATGRCPVPEGVVIRLPNKVGTGAKVLDEKEMASGFKGGRWY